MPANISGSAPAHVGHRAQIALSDHLRLETIFDAMGVPDHTDHGPSHRKNSAVIVLCKDLLGLSHDCGRSCLRERAGSTRYALHFCFTAPREYQDAPASLASR